MARPKQNVRLRVGATVSKPSRPLPPSRALPFLDLLGFSDPGPGAFDVVPPEPVPSPTQPPIIEQPDERAFDRLVERVTAAVAALPAVADRAASKIAALRAAPATTTQPDPAEPDHHLSIFDLLPRLSDFRSDEASDNTGTLVQRLWEATDSYQPAGSWTWEGDDLVGRPRPNRVVIGLIVAAVAAILAIAVSNLGGGTPPEARSLAETLADAGQSLTEARQVAELIAHPETSGEDLSNAAITLTELDSAALDLTARGEELLTDPATEDSGHALLRAGALARGTGRKLGHALTYRLVFSRTFALPDLPLDAEGTDVADLGFQISAMISETRSSLARLPADSTLDSHHEQADAALVAIENITPDYLQALRDGDGLTARVHANGIIRQAADIQAALAGPLQEVAEAVNIQLDGYAAELSQAETLHPAP